MVRENSLWPLPRHGCANLDVRGHAVPRLVCRPPRALEACVASCWSWANQLLFWRVRAAFFAARDRSFALRFFAAAFAWRDKARCEAAARGCFFRARCAARERVAEGFPEFPALLSSRSACVLVRLDVFPFLGGGH